MSHLVWDFPFYHRPLHSSVLFIHKGKRSRVNWLAISRSHWLEALTSKVAFRVSLFNDKGKRSRINWLAISKSHWMKGELREHSCARYPFRYPFWMARANRQVLIDWWSVDLIGWKHWPLRSHFGFPFLMTRAKRSRINWLAISKSHWMKGELREHSCAR